ncbi:MAG: ABC transporter permease subunit [Christensenellales bacterium]
MENKKGKLGSRLAGSEAFLSVAASLVCIVIGLLLGLIVLAIINAEHAFGDGLMVILQSGFKSQRNMGTVLANAAPLIMTGLSVGFAFKTGLFNIGAAGQYTLGAFGALYCAIVLQWPWYPVPAGGDGIRRGLGRAAGHFQGVSEHQRGHHGHHVQLDRPVYGQRHHVRQGQKPDV